MPGRKLAWVLTGVGIAILMAGCAPVADLSMKFNPNDSTVYKVTAEMVKSLRFEQPSAGKLREENTVTTIETTFVEQVESIDRQEAVAVVTIKDLRYFEEQKGQVKTDFDSKRQADAGKPLSKIIGQSYKIRIAGDGSVTVADADSARKLNIEGHPGRLAQAFFSDKGIISRHEVLSLPSSENSTVKTGNAWTTVKAPPPDMLVPKSFAKTYKLTKMENADGKQLAFVQMNAVESAEPAGQGSQFQSKLGPFAKMFDAEDNFAGSMVFDVVTGKVIEYNEKLSAKYIIVESPKNQKPDVGPDALTIGFVHSVSRELLE